MEHLIDKLCNCYMGFTEPCYGEPTDHTSIGRRFRRSLQDIRVKRGADADAASYHHLVTPKLLRECTKTCYARIKYSVELLCDKRTTKEFQLALTHGYQAPQDMTEEENSCILDSRWQHVNAVWTETCEETPVCLTMCIFLITGWCRDYFGNYKVSFIFMAVSMAVSSVLSYVAGALSRHKCTKTERLQEL